MIAKNRSSTDYNMRISSMPPRTHTRIDVPEDFLLFCLSRDIYKKKKEKK